jgi:hypothetical protein
MAEEAPVSIRRIDPPELGVPPGYSQVVKVRGGRILLIAGQAALDRKKAALNAHQKKPAEVPTLGFRPPTNRSLGEGNERSRWPRIPGRTWTDDDPR